MYIDMSENIFPAIPGRMPFHYFLTAIIYLKPGKTSAFIEEALAYGIQKVFEENKDFQWLFRGRNSAGSCGVTHNSLDAAIDGLHFTRIAYSSDYQFCHLTSLGRAAASTIKKESGDDFAKLKPLAEEVWRRAREYQSMYNRPELYA